VFTDDLVLNYHFNLRKQHLLRLCATWKSQVRPIPVHMPDSWGPSDQEVQDMQRSEYQPRWGNHTVTDDQINDGLDGEEMEFQEDEELIDAIEASAWIHEDYNSNEFSLEHSIQVSAEEYSFKQASSSSPRKRSRLDYDI
jgi:hypothetical protein